MIDGSFKSETERNCKTFLKEEVTQRGRKRSHTKRKCRSERKSGRNKKRRTVCITELFATDSKRERVLLATDRRSMKI